MASVSLYDQIYCSKDGSLLQELTEIELTFDGDDQDVFTIAKGFAGQSPSPKKVMCTLTNVVPTDGQEVDAFEAALLSKKVKMKFQFGGSGKALTSEGFIRKPKLSAGVAKTVSQTFEFHGGAGTWS
jgi:hypothetical protein